MWDVASNARRVRAHEFPAGLDWLNTKLPMTLERLRGRIVILDFWTYGCINCMHVIPDLKRLEAEYPAELVVIGVHSAKFDNERDTENIRKIISRYGLHHPVVNDRDFILWNLWGVRAWPTIVLIDPQGNVAGSRSGEGVYGFFKPIIDNMVRDFDTAGLLDSNPLDVGTVAAECADSMLSFPGKVLPDESGGRVFVADTGNNRVVLADMGSGEALDFIGSGYAGFDDGDFADASFDHPQGMALSPGGRWLYIADTGNHAIRLADLKSRRVLTVAGTGAQAFGYVQRAGEMLQTALNSPWDLALDDQRLYIAMAGAHQIWVLDLLNRFIVPVVGTGREGTADGPLASADLAQPSGLALDDRGWLYFADAEGSSIRRAGAGTADGRVETLVGSGRSLFEFGDVDGIGRSARLQHPLGLAYHDGFIYVADTYNSKVKRLAPATARVETLPVEGVVLDEPGGISAAGDRLYVADTNNNAIRVIDLETNRVTALIQ